MLSPAVKFTVPFVGVTSPPLTLNFQRSDLAATPLIIASSSTPWLSPSTYFKVTLPFSTLYVVGLIWRSAVLFSLLVSKLATFVFVVFNWLPVTASVEFSDTSPSFRLVIFLPPTSTPLLLIATVVAPPCNVNVSPVIDVIPVKSDFILTLYLLPSVPSPLTVVFVPSASLDGAAPPPPPADALSSFFKVSLNFNLYLRVTPFVPS